MIKVSVDHASIKRFQHRMQDFVEEAGKTTKEAMELLAKACAKELAITVRPFGISPAIGKKFMDSIGKQIDYTWHGANKGVFPSSSMESAHKAARNSRGQVRMRKFKKTTEANENISVAQKEIYKRKTIKNAGMAKGAWIAAGEKLNGKKIAGVGKWVRRHAKQNGSAGVIVRGMGADVVLTNQVQFISNLQKSEYVEKALKRGYQRNFKHMTIVVKKIRKEI